MKIKVISLKSSTDRRNNFNKKNQHLDYQFYDAVDGYELPEEIYYNQQIIKNVSNYTIGALGCALSHLNLWNEVIDTNEPMTIMEDDAIVRYDFEEKQRNIISELNKDWDIVYWGYNLNNSWTIARTLSESIEYGFYASLPDNTQNVFQPCNSNVSILKLISIWGTSCYSISPNGAKKYKEACFPLNSFNYNINTLNKNIANITVMGIDGAMDHFHSKTNGFLCFPPLSFTPNKENESTVQKTI
jgi:GR25 family glycosyltransferase involved in LPS biosynthesis